MQGKFFKWVESQHKKGVKWDVQWPLRTGTGERLKEEDMPPRVTSNGDYVLYHGTGGHNAMKIINQRVVNHDDFGCVGVTTNASFAGVYGSMKYSMNKTPSNYPTVLQLIIDKDWLLKQTITREIGGSGRDQWLIRVDNIPSAAIVDLKIHSILGVHPPEKEDLEAVMQSS